MTGPTSNPTGAAAIADTITPKRAAFIRWAKGRALDVTEDRDAWGQRTFAQPHVESMWFGWFYSEAVVYPPDGTFSPFTVINLGGGQVKMGDCLHDDRLPGLWFGRGGLGMGVEEELNRRANTDETLAVVTFGNVEGLDVLLDVVQRIRRIKFPGAPAQASDQPEFISVHDGAPRGTRLYLAGPMSGIPSLNFPLFNAEAARLRALGYEITNPAEINGGADELVACASMTPEQLAAHWRACMRRDIPALLECDGVALLPGWQHSKGASLEVHVASKFDMQIGMAGDLVNRAANFNDVDWAAA